MDPFDALKPVTDLPLAANKDNDSDAAGRIAELANLSPLAYEETRETAARDLGFRVSVLDAEVAKLRPTEAAPTDAAFPDLEPWPTSVCGADLLDQIKAAILRFCILPDDTADIIAAWVIHCHAHDAFDISPILAILSPEKRCGKTTLASVVGALVPRPMHLIGISPAVLFRVVEHHKPTLIIDEGDTFLGENEEMRGLLNGGHNRQTAYVWRCHGDDHEPRRFSVWGPKLVAMIGQPPDTVSDRSLTVKLRRKLPGEVVERFHCRRIGELAPVAQMAASWANDNAISLADADPGLPDELNDRAQDNARAIVAIADLAGGDWPARIRGALIGSAREIADDEPATKGTLLLSDIQEVTARWKGATIGSTDLLAQLLDLPESPWPEWRRGQPITTRGIAQLLKPFGVHPSRDRHGRFYRLTDFSEAFDRYLSDTPQKSDTSDPSVTDTPKQHKKHNNNNVMTLDAGYDAYSGVTEGKRHNVTDSVTGEQITASDFR